MKLKKLILKNYRLIQSSERWVDLKKMNKLGLHLLRSILAEKNFSKKNFIFKKK